MTPGKKAAERKRLRMVNGYVKKWLQWLRLQEKQRKVKRAAESEWLR